MQHFEHRFGIARPADRALAQLAAALLGQLVVLGLAVVVGKAPLGLDEAALLEAVEGGIEGAVLDVEVVLGGGTDPGGDGVAVAGSPAQGLENEDIEGALEEVEFSAWHAFP